MGFGGQTQRSPGRIIQWSRLGEELSLEDIDDVVQNAKGLK